MDSSAPAPAETYALTRFVLLRWLGLIYLVAFSVAVRQLVPLVGASGLTPAPLYLHAVRAHVGSGWEAFYDLPTLFWLDCSDTWLQGASWLGLLLSAMVLAGYANALVLATLWALYLSIVGVGQSWYGYGWEIQLLETGFLAIFLCPLLDARPFPGRPAPYAVILLFRWLIVRIMLGSALIKLRGDSSWTDLTALYTFFETQPIPNPLSRSFHFLPHFLLQAGVLLTFMVELVAPWFVFWPRWGRLIAGALIIGFQVVLILCGNLSFFNWLTIQPALACFDDRFWRALLPVRLLGWANRAQREEKPCRPMIVTSWIVAALVGLLSIAPVLNLLSPDQAMNTSYDPFHLVNTYGAFGTVGRERPVVIFEGTASATPETATDWKEYHCVALPDDPMRWPTQIAPYQPHLDWQLWFVALAAQNSSRDALEEYPWTLNLIWKLLHNDPATLGLLAGNPFPDQPPKYIRVVLYRYHFAPPGDPTHACWSRETLGTWLPPLSVDSPGLLGVLRQEGWL